MFLVKVENLSIEINGVQILKNISFEVKKGERIAIIGENGVGKTTLLNAVFGQLTKKAGHVYFAIEKEEIGLMVQESPGTINRSVKDFVSYDHPNYYLKKELEKWSALLQEQALNDEVIQSYNNILEKYLAANGYEWEAEIELALKQMGIQSNLWDVSIASLSGGQKTKVKLAKIMMISPKLLVLDEPTNHLDEESIHWLAEWLIQFKGSVLFISHDRAFIDKIATSTYELSKNKMKKYEGGYASYKKLKELEIKTIQAQYARQEMERKKLTETIVQYKNWFNKANNAASVRDPYSQKKAAKQATKYKAKEKAMERLENNKISKPEEKKMISANLNVHDFSGRKMLEVANVSFSYGNEEILKDIHFTIHNGDRIAIIGKNGSGKTTLLKLLSNNLEVTSGHISTNPQVIIGFFYQELENLQVENTILEEILTIPNMKESDARTILACFLFRREDVFKKIHDLSMGEKCRVAFVKLYFSDANLLILDEPTNYFDITAKETIENALENYPGSLVIVSHDPYLHRKVANKVIHIQDGKANIFLGSYQEWEKHQSVSPDIQQLTNELERLELQLLQLLTEENIAENREEKRLDEIKQLKRKIDAIKLKINV
ncbi:ABC-F type ribosomal protection protein [Caldibacillus lycopersici]|uniref:ABC-F type ribosomal protection protein n=1 Tax=Perspicuibacillus lycopersici TaxID=1325689 RepID=A0AAE3IW83_9BACI|nr:ABC-F type ribosomal protection protein [Perspicuibacillus lycopersici]MCU9614748.1 ABC-F type ribosomal protection protein [Perspicuibacillus lycopersici]